MRPALPAALLLVVLGNSLPADADWLVLVGGKKIQTEGPWTLKGDLLTVHEITGRIVTVGTNTVDAAACLKLNGGSLRIEAIAVAPPPGAPVSKPEVDAVPPAGATRTAKTARPAKGKASTKAAAGAGQATSANVAGTASPATPASGAATPAGEDRSAAAKAKQAQLQRELRYKQIVDGCSRMFIVDRAGFQHCVDVQTKASPR
jgi:hypothetical protein